MLFALHLVLSAGVSIKSPPSPLFAFVPISDKDMTEIELYSVDSINDLHRTHAEQHSKGTGVTL